MWPFRRHPAHEIRTFHAHWVLRDGVGDAGRMLETSLDCDIAIIGAGITGALIADGLVATGQRIVMLERHEPAMGSTAASTALLQYELDTHLVDLTRRFGADLAARAYRAGVQAFALLESRYPELLAHSDYERRESVYLAARREDVAVLQAETAARRAIGIHAEWIGEKELARRYGCRRPGAVVSALGAMLDPVRFTRGLLSACARHGVEIYSRSGVEAIEDTGDRLRLHTSRGHRVNARQVVVAAGYDSLPFLKRSVGRVDNTFALVTEPVADGRQVRAMPQIWESARPYLYLRGTRDGRIMLGGADLPFKNEHARDLLLSRQSKKIAEAYEDLFGHELPPVAWAWAGSFAQTEDGLPRIGRAPGEDPRLWFALCFGGNGTIYAVHAADMIRQAIEGGSHALDSVFGFTERDAADDQSRAAS